MITRTDLNIIMQAIGTCSGCKHLNKTNCTTKNGISGCIAKSEYFATDAFVKFINQSIEKGEPLRSKRILDLNHNWYMEYIEKYTLS